MNFDSCIVALIHEFGPVNSRALETGERLCTDDVTDDCRIVYHVHAIPLEGLDWTCWDCGYTTERVP